MRICAMSLWISIHAPREGGDIVDVVEIPQDLKFQSTPPTRGATHFRP